MSVTEMNEASAHAARSATPVLRAVGVVKRFGDNVVLRGLDLDVASHEVVVLLGASGSGKSTLLRCANLLERVDDGQIFWAARTSRIRARTRIRSVRASAWCSSTTTCSRTCRCWIT